LRLESEPPTAPSTESVVDCFFGGALRRFFFEDALFFLFFGAALAAGSSFRAGCASAVSVGAVLALLVVSTSLTAEDGGSVAAPIRMGASRQSSETTLVRMMGAAKLALARRRREVKPAQADCESKTRPKYF
tara:strand:- start:117 stop:512 length:396 start_codon:yes stop_codon:yes gene_type:complete